MKAKLSVLTAMLGLLLVMTGCANCKRQLAQLEEDKRDLAAQKAMAEDQLVLTEAQLTECQQDMAAAQNRLLQLGQDLADARVKKEPKLPARWQEKKGMIMTSLPNKVLFAAGKATLKRGAAGALRQIQAEINRNFPGFDVYIIGHTDSDRIKKSNWKDNLELSQQRAAAVARHMINKGMNSKKVIVGGCGKYRPIASNTTAAGKARNRRVEFWVLKPVK